MQGISLQSLDVILCVEELQKLRKQYHEKVESERSANRLVQVVDLLFERPMLSIRQLASMADLPYLTAQRYVETLEKMDILREVTGKSRNRIYLAAEILKVMDRS